MNEHFMSIPVSEFEELHDRLTQTEKKAKRLQGQLEKRNREIAPMVKWIFNHGKHHHRSYAHSKAFAKCEFPICKSANEILKDWEVT